MRLLMIASSLHFDSFLVSAMICQTSGHFDFRGYLDVATTPGDSLSYQERVGHVLIADGVPDCLKRTRGVLRMGGSQIKIAGGGGVGSTCDPADVQEFTYEEVKAIVDAAACWGTYVTAHVFADNGIKNCLKAGVKCIEHGMLASDETLDLMKEHGVWLSLQCLFDDELKMESNFRLGRLRHRSTFRLRMAPSRLESVPERME